MCARKAEAGRSFSTAFQAAVRAAGGNAHRGDAGCRCRPGNCLLYLRDDQRMMMRRSACQYQQEKTASRGRAMRAIFSTWHGMAGQYLYMCVGVCVSPGRRRRRHADEVPRDLHAPTKRGQASKQANLAGVLPRKQQRIPGLYGASSRSTKRGRVSRLEAGRRYRRVYCLTLGICYDDAVLGMRSPRPGRTGEGGSGPGRRQREAAGEEMGTGASVGHLPDLLVCCWGSGEGVLWLWWLEKGELGKWGHVCFSGWGVGGLFCFVIMSTMDSRDWVSCLSALFELGRLGKVQTAPDVETSPFADWKL